MTTDGMADILRWRDAGSTVPVCRRKAQAAVASCSRDATKRNPGRLGKGCSSASRGVAHLDAATVLPKLAAMIGALDANREAGPMRIHFAAATMLILLLGAPAEAEVRILASPGGEIGPFLDLFAQVRASGERVVIDGPCLSACTLVLSTVPASRICVTRRAVLGFHAARSMDRRGRFYAEPEASELVLEAYPSPVRRWIEHRGGLTSRLLLLRGRELAGIYPVCR
jgi:hypothetical protein